MRKIFFATVALLISAGTAFAAPITVNGTYSISQTGSASLTTLLSTPFTLNLDVGTPSSKINLFSELQTVATTNNAITANFSISGPGTGAGSLTGTESFRITGNARHDELVWANSGLLNIALSNGTILQIALGDDTYDGVSTNYAGLTSTAQFTLTSGPTAAVPEPSVVFLLGAGLLGLTGFLQRRRRRYRHIRHD